MTSESTGKPSEWRISGFADEVGPDFQLQLDTMTKLGVGWIELRSAWNTNVVRLSDEQVKTAKSMLTKANIQVSSIGSPIGKISIHDDFDRHIPKMERAAQLAQEFEAPYVRVFSFFIEQGDDPDRHRDEVLRRMSVIAKIAADHGVVAVHENEKDIYGDIARRCVDIAESVGSDHLRLVMDPANFVQCGEKPFDDAYAIIRPHLEYMHIKDAHFSDNSVCVAGEGDGQVRQIIRALRDDGFTGFFSLEPHLGEFDAFGGQCGPELWATAHYGFVKMLTEEGIAYS